MNLICFALIAYCICWKAEFTKQLLPPTNENQNNKNALETLSRNFIMFSKFIVFVLNVSFNIGLVLLGIDKMQSKSYISTQMRTFTFLVFVTNSSCLRV